MPEPTRPDLDAFYLGPDGEVWKILTYCEHPTISYYRVDDLSITRAGAVGSPIVSGFIRLVGELPTGHSLAAVPGTERNPT